MSYCYTPTITEGSLSPLFSAISQEVDPPHYNPISPVCRSFEEEKRLSGAYPNYCANGDMPEAAGSSKFGRGRSPYSFSMDVGRGQHQQQWKGATGGGDILPGVMRLPQQAGAWGGCCCQPISSQVGTQQLSPAGGVVNNNCHVSLPSVLDISNVASPMSTTRPDWREGKGGRLQTGLANDAYRPPPGLPRPKKYHAAPIMNGKRLLFHFHSSYSNSRRPDSTVLAPTNWRIITFSDGEVAKIPANVVNDQFGMAGLLTTMQLDDVGPSLTKIALDYDRNLDSGKSLCPNFGDVGPTISRFTAEGEIGQLVDSNLSRNDRIGFVCFIQERLEPLKINTFKEDILFNLFYKCKRDVLRVIAADELFQRNWRYDKDKKIWITRIPGIVPIAKVEKFETGIFFYFDPNVNQKVKKVLMIDHDKMEGRPILPNYFTPSYLLF